MELRKIWKRNTLKYNLERHSLNLIFLLIILIEYSIRFLYLFFGKSRYIVTQLAIDDSYYYFETAWNTKIYGFVTFDSLNNTNGVHFLWFWILVLLSFLIFEKLQFLLAIMIVCLTLNTIDYFIIWKIGKLLENEKFGILIASFWMILSFNMTYFMSGLENSLHAFIIWIIIYSFIKILKNGVTTNNYLQMTILLILNVWTRYDAVFLSAVIYLYLTCLVFFHFREGSDPDFSYKSLLISIILIIVGGIIQFTGFYLMGGSIIPVSAQVKSYLSVSRPLEQYISNIIFIISPVRLNIFNNQVNMVLSLIFFGIFILTNFWILKKLCNKKLNHEENSQIYIVILTFSISIFLYSLIMAKLYYKYYFWYLSPNYILSLLIISSFLYFIFIPRIFLLLNKIRYLKKIKPMNLETILICGVLISSLFLFFYLNGFSPEGRNIDSENSFYSLRYDVALWIKENIDKNAIIGSWNAGQLGFFSFRRIINLDGLINSNTYFNNIIKSEGLYRGTDFSAYIDDMNISYIVDYNFYGFNPSNNSFVKLIEFIFQKDGRAIQVWEKIPKIS